MRALVPVHLLKDVRAARAEGIGIMKLLTKFAGKKGRSCKVCILFDWSLPGENPIVSSCLGRCVCVGFGSLKKSSVSIHIHLRNIISPPTEPKPQREDLLFFLDFGISCRYKLSLQHWRLRQLCWQSFTSATLFFSSTRTRTCWQASIHIWAHGIL